MSQAALAPGSHEICAATARLRTARATTLALLLTLALAAVLSSSMGAMRIAPAQMVSILAERLTPFSFGSHNAIQSGVFFDIRLPRVMLAILVGAAMAGAGTAMQSLFRNPLADPGIVGVSSGAALGAVAWIVLASSFAPFAALAAVLGVFAQPAAAFAGGLAASLFVYRLARRAVADGQTFMLLLAGIAFSALAGAATGLLTYMADDQQLRSITFWTMGSLGGAGWSEVRVVLAFLLPAACVLALFGRLLDALLLGESVAGHLGFEMRRVRPVLVVCVAVLVGASVAMTGMIGFVGLMAPHIARQLVGPGHRYLLPAAALCGALLLLVADIFARTIVAPAEVPVGIITALIGGPFFLFLLYRHFGDHS